MGDVRGRRARSLRAVLGVATAISLAFPAYAQDLSHPVCNSASLWELPGPRDEIQIGERKLSVPRALDAYTISGGMLSFAFHIKPDGNLELDEDPGEDIGWHHQLTFYILDEDGISDTAETQNLLMNLGFPGIPEQHPDVKGFDAYKGQDWDVYVARTKSYYLAFACINKFRGYNGPWSPWCEGHRRPWPGSSLTFDFGRQFIAVSPVIDACISKMLEDFSEPGTGKVTQ